MEAMGCGVPLLPFSLEWVFIGPLRPCERMKPIKRFLRRIPWIIDPVTRYRGRRLEEYSLAEEEFYQRRARELGLSYSLEDSRQRLAKRLQHLGIKPKAKGSLHVFAMFTHAGWENDQWPDQVRLFGKVTFLDWRKEGFNNLALDWGREGRRALGRHVLTRIREAHHDQPVDTFFGYLSAEIIDPWVLESIANMGIFTFNVGYDDLSYSFRGGKPFTDPCMGTGGLVSAFDLNVTSMPQACKKYLVEGGIPLYLPLGANPLINHPLDLEKDLEVSFVGSSFGTRSMWMRYLRKQGIKVETFGRGWPRGHVSTKEMIQIYNRSQINLGHAALGDSDSRRLYCFKTRDFQIPMSGGFYMAQYFAELADCYDIGREIVCYHDYDDLMEKIHYFLAHSEETEEIARAGRARAFRDHTWEKRFETIFRFSGLVEE